MRLLSILKFTLSKLFALLRSSKNCKNDLKLIPYSFVTLGWGIKLLK